MRRCLIPASHYDLTLRDHPKLQAGPGKSQGAFPALSLAEVTAQMDLFRRGIIEGSRELPQHFPFCLFFSLLVPLDKNGKRT